MQHDNNKIIEIAQINFQMLPKKGENTMGDLKGLKSQHLIMVLK